MFICMLLKRNNNNFIDIDGDVLLNFVLTFAPTRKENELRNSEREFLCVMSFDIVDKFELVKCVYLTWICQIITSCFRCVALSPSNVNRLHQLFSLSARM